MAGSKGKAIARRLAVFAGVAAVCACAVLLLASCGGEPNKSPNGNPATEEKPVIYLYPEEECEVEVALSFDGELSCVYPAFAEARRGDGRDGGAWRVVARPDGTLVDPATGREHGYLFWEGESDWTPDLGSGFCVAGADTAEFLEGALRDLGLTDREADDFITYWLPRMQGNPYNLIAFQGEAYADAARLEVDPAPDTVIRVFMAWRPLDAPVDVGPQELSAPERTGFAVVEWGGTELSPSGAEL